uniref:Orn/DAP/Arg decarboxylase 2 N-terminal domain-containing protein n=1 Tax=Anopheles farauti TaxID=69004 RepID=A0A182QQB9_9DIPT
MESSSEHSCYAGASATELLERIVREGATDTAINILDLDAIVHNVRRWTEAAPDLVPFYLPSANNHPAVLALLGKLGVGFSCASIGEMRSVLRFGVPPERIILAHPAKSPETILYARQEGIRRIVCDSVQEIGKVHRLYPTAQIVLRVRVCVEQKFGCCPDNDLPEILRYVQSLEPFHIAGVHFAMPQERLQPGQTLRQVLFTAERTMAQVTASGQCDVREFILSGTGKLPSSQLQKVLSEFSLKSNVQVIVETERQFVQSAVTLVTSIQSKRVVRETEPSGPIREIMYFINDGRYGSFEWWWNALDMPPPVVHRSVGTVSPTPTHPSSLWGPSCDSADMVCERLYLPDLEIGDFLVFPDMGAYGVTLASCFNGFPIPRTVVCACSEATKALLQDMS